MFVRVCRCVNLSIEFVKCYIYKVFVMKIPLFMMKFVVFVVYLIFI